jgi:hypothetical protein
MRNTAASVPSTIVEGNFWRKAVILARRPTVPIIVSYRKAANGSFQRGTQVRTLPLTNGI